MVSSYFSHSGHIVLSKTYHPKSFLFSPVKAAYLAFRYRKYFARNSELAPVTTFVSEFCFPYNCKGNRTAIVTARLQAVFKPSSRPSSSRLQDRLQAVFKTLRLRESAADLAPTSELRISRGVCCCRYSFCCLNSHPSGFLPPTMSYVTYDVVRHARTTSYV